MNKIIKSYLIKKLLLLISRHRYTSSEKIVILKLFQKLKIKND